jgi:1,4-dihydroxy-2-naphthoate polyprenyltransferase
VLGTYFVQASQITAEPVLAGIVSGVLSSTVLFVNSFPDHDADKSHGRRTLVILLGRAKAASSVWIFPATSYGVIITAVALHLFPIVSLVTLVTIPIVIKSGMALKQKFDLVEEFVPIMKNFVSYSRITGVLLVVSFIVDHLMKIAQ